MPPRGTAAANAASSAQAQQDAILEAEGIESYELPKALVTRIAKSGVSYRPTQYAVLNADVAFFPVGIIMPWRRRIYVWFCGRGIASAVSEI
jgi:hypothetical protein